MPRGFVYRGYTCDNGDVFQTLVDADEALITDRGWVAPTVGADLLPKQFVARRVFGISPTSGRRGKTRVGSTSCDLWTGVVTSFTVELDTGAVDTLTVIGRRQERRRLAH